MLGLSLGMGAVGCGGSLEPTFEFRVEGTVTGATANAGAYAVVTGQLYEGGCGTGTLRQTSTARAGVDGRFSVGFGVAFSGCIRLIATSTSATGSADRTGVQAGGAGAKVVQMDVVLGVP